MAQPWAYVDTSVLVKQYVGEPGSSQARVLLRRHRVLSSAIAPVEALSALARRRAVGDLAERDFVAIANRMHKDRAHWTLVEVSPLVLNRAEEFIMEPGVRTLDAIHLASAVTIQAALGIPIPFLTGDARQQDAAARLAMDIVWVG